MDEYKFKYKCCICGNEFEPKELKFVRNARDVTTFDGVHYKVMAKGIMCNNCFTECDKHQKELQEAQEKKNSK